MKLKSKKFKILLMQALLKKTIHLSLYSIYDTYRLGKRNRIANNSIKKYIASNKILKLHIGAGGSILDGWLNTDVEHFEKGSIYLDASAPFNIPNDTFDFIYSEHLFEHLNIEGQLNMLSESLRILKKGGVCRIATPNLDFLLSVVLEDYNDFNQQYLNWAYENYFPKNTFDQFFEIDKKVHFLNHYFHNWGHQFIHNASSFLKLASNFTFSLIVQKDVYESNYGCFINIETHGKVITPEYNIAETMVFELVK